MSSLTDRIQEILRDRVIVDQHPHPKLGTPCWRFVGRSNRNGYKRVCIEGKEPVAHRWLYEFLYGEVEKGLLLDHLCRDRSCCAPHHLEPVTTQVNTLRGDARLFRKKEDYVLQV